MGYKDLSTAIQGHLYVIQNVNNPLMRIKSALALEQLRTQISNDKRLNAGPLMVQVNHALAAVYGEEVVEYEQEFADERMNKTASVCGALTLWTLGLAVTGMYAIGLNKLING